MTNRMKNDGYFEEIWQKNWKFEQEFGAKVSKNQYEIKVCNENDEINEEWRLFWRNLTEKIENLSRNLGQKYRKINMK